jgi:hypothetical protein
MRILVALLLLQDPLPPGSTLVLEESWEKIDPARWYLPRKRWGQGNHGVLPENVRVENGVLVCEAHGDPYDGAAAGIEGNKSRVGGVIVSKAFFASGRFEVSIRIGSASPQPGGPADPKRPIGAVPAIWTYAFRPGSPELLSELDFPEFGKGGVFEKALYNAYCQAKEHTSAFDVSPVIDGQFHTLTTDWRTERVPAEDVTDAQTVERDGVWWLKDDRKQGNPFRRLDKDKYLMCRGARALHRIDGKKVGETTEAVPCMAAQLTLGVWLPGWGGPAPWKTSTVSFGRVRIWQYGDPGDVRGVLTQDLKDNFDRDGTPRR